MNKLIITKLRGRMASVLVSESRVLQIDFEEEQPSGRLGTIYIGKVRNVVRNLNAAFVEYQPGVNGYYSLSENTTHLFADGSRGAGPIKAGDDILVQVARAAVKTKDAVLSSALMLTGRYAVVSLGERKLGISLKIRDKDWRDSFKEQWEKSDVPDCSVIIRTNACKAPFSVIYEEVLELSSRLEKLRADAAFRTSFQVLHQPDSFPVLAVRSTRLSETEEVVTDLPEVYRELSESSLFAGEETDLKLRLYGDSYPLTALYHLESALDRALSKTVWLKSGGYLVIEPTEAMTVIDVNTGKNVERKTAAEVYFKTNLEAAVEIAAQLRLRNLSGIIIVDFIDMDSEKQKTELMNRFRSVLSTDPIKTVLVDMTALGLVEVTRKKTKKPLYEQLSAQVK